jgi:hypothetical protein
MTRAHRRWHFWLWLLLVPLLAAGFVAGVLTRPRPEYEAPRFPHEPRSVQPREVQP